MSSCCLELQSRHEEEATPQLTLVERVESTARTIGQRTQTQLRKYAPAARSLLELALIATALLSFAFMT